MSSLRNIMQFAYELQAHALENGGELTPELEQELTCTGEQLASKVDGYRYFWSLNESHIEWLKGRADEFLRAAKILENVQERSKAHVLTLMQEMKLSELHGDEAKIRVVDTAGSVQILSEMEIPADLCETVITRKPNKVEIKERIKAGEDVPGARFVPGKTLRVSVYK